MRGRTHRAPKGAYGDYFTEHFWLAQQKFHVTRTVSRGVLAVTQIKSETPTPEPTQPIAYDDAHLVGFQVWNSPGHELWLEGKAAKSEPFKIGETAFYDLRRSPGAYMPHAYHSLQFYLPHAALRDIAEQHDRRFNGDLRYKFGIPESDHIVQHLGTALLPALERGEAIDGLFLDHILHAVATHVVDTYSDSAFGLRRATGGLASWQERRAKELMRFAHRCGHLAEGIGGCVRAFSDAFRAGISPVCQDVTASLAAGAEDREGNGAAAEQRHGAEGYRTGVRVCGPEPFHAGVFAAGRDQPGAMAEVEPAIAASGGPHPFALEARTTLPARGR